MRHLIIGAGTIGESTGALLEANKEEVSYCDLKIEVRNKLKEKGKNLSSMDNEFDIYWICTAEWNVESILKCVPKVGTVVVRSTTPPGSIKKWAKQYRIDLFHIPEFVRQSTNIYDEFHPDRIIIGETTSSAKNVLKPLLELFTPRIPILITDSTTSETIKLVSNAWLSTQISFWNEIKKLCEKLELNPQFVSNAVCLDKRISDYGAMMTGLPFAGMCLPKDLVSLLRAFKEADLENRLLEGVEKVNKC